MELKYSPRIRVWCIRVVYYTIMNGYLVCTCIVLISMIMSKDFIMKKAQKNFYNCWHSEPAQWTELRISLINIKMLIVCHLLKLLIYATMPSLTFQEVEEMISKNIFYKGFLWASKLLCRLSWVFWIFFFFEIVRKA